MKGILIIFKTRSGICSSLSKQTSPYCEKCIQNFFIALLWFLKLRIYLQILKIKHVQVTLCTFKKPSILLKATMTCFTWLSRHSYNTRTKNSFRWPSCRTNVRKCSLCYQSHRCFNFLNHEKTNGLVLAFIPLNLTHLSWYKHIFYFLSVSLWMPFFGLDLLFVYLMRV